MTAAIAGSGLEVVILDDAGRRRQEHDERVLADVVAEAADPTGLVHVYGLPRDEAALARVAAARRGARRLLWTPAAALGPAARGAAAVARHFERQGRDRESRRLLFRALAAGSLHLPPDDGADRMLLRGLNDLVDLRLFACDEELRGFAAELEPGATRICPLAVAIRRPAVRVAPGAPVLVTGAVGDFAVREALADLHREVVALDALGGVTTELAFLAAPADARVDPRLLELAAAGLPVVCDPGSFLLDYLGPDARIVPFADIDRLCRVLAALLVEPETTRVGQSAGLVALFDAARAAAALRSARASV